MNARGLDCCGKLKGKKREQVGKLLVLSFTGFSSHSGVFQIVDHYYIFPPLLLFLLIGETHKLTH